MDIIIDKFVIYGAGDEEILLKIVAEFEPPVASSAYGHADDSDPGDCGMCQIHAILHNDRPWLGQLTKEQTREVYEAIEYAFKAEIEHSKMRYDEPDSSIYR